MTLQEIQERNKEIALMLGWKTILQLEEINEENEHLKDCYFLPYTELVFWSVENLKFHSDWNWLMDAIQFLKKHFESKEMYWTTIEKYPLYSNIEDVFIVVSDFAKHYNNKEI